MDDEFLVRSVELRGGVTLPYVEQGDPEGVSLIFLHAIGDSWRAFERLFPHLPESIHAIAPSQRGHGDASRPTTGYRPGDFAVDLSLFMEAIGRKAAVLVGGSSGGFIARRFAIDHPERTLGLVLLGSPATLRDKPRAVDLWETTISTLTDPIDPTFARDFVAGTVVRPVPEAFLETLVRESLKAPARVWKATYRGLLEDDSFDELERIEAPTVVIWGDQDSILPRSDQESLAAAIPGARLVVYRGAGHCFYWEDPERVASDVVAFATSVAPA